MNIPSFLPALFRAAVIGATLLPLSPLHAGLVFFSWWNPLYKNPGLLSNTGGGYSRDARLPDQEDIVLVVNDTRTKTNQEIASILVVPPESSVFGTDPFTGRAQTDFGQNRTQTRTFITGFGESANREYYDRRSHSMSAQSIWSDRWVFTGPGVGTSAVTLSATFNVEISNSPCATGNCGQVGNPIFDRSGIIAWWYRIYGAIRIFDLDIIDDLYLPDREFNDEVPHEVAGFGVFQQGSKSAQEFFGPLEPFENIPNKRLSPIHTNGTFTFIPVPGHRYAVVGDIKMQSRDGADVEICHLTLDQVELGPGLQLQSFGQTNGAAYRIVSATRITALPTLGGAMTLSFPTTTGLTYHVESRDSLSNTPWNTLATKAGNNQTQTVTDNDGIKTARFYRLRIE